MRRWIYVLLLLGAVDVLLGASGAVVAAGGRGRLIAYWMLVLALIALSVAVISMEQNAQRSRRPASRPSDEPADEPLERAGETDGPSRRALRTR